MVQTKWIPNLTSYVACFGCQMVQTKRIPSRLCTYFVFGYLHVADETDWKFNKMSTNEMQSYNCCDDKLHWRPFLTCLFRWTCTVRFFKYHPGHVIAQTFHFIWFLHAFPVISFPSNRIPLKYNCTLILTTCMSTTTIKNLDFVFFDLSSCFLNPNLDMSSFKIFISFNLSHAFPAISFLCNPKPSKYNRCVIVHVCWKTQSHLINYL